MNMPDVASLVGYNHLATPLIVPTIDHYDSSETGMTAARKGGPGLHTINEKTIFAEAFIMRRIILWKK